MMRLKLLILALLLSYSGLFAKEYRSMAVGYIFEQSQLNDDQVEYTSDVYNYGYRFNAFYMTQNYLVVGEFAYYPNQNFAKGFQNDYRFTSTMEQITFRVDAGLKKYIIPYVFFAPTIGLRFTDYQSDINWAYNNTHRSTHDSLSQIPLSLHIGYSVTPTSDILFGIDIDEDLSDLNTHDYKEYTIKYFLTFRNNITINSSYARISQSNPNDDRQVIQLLSLTIGFRF